jgi:polyamine oxidase
VTTPELSRRRFLQLACAGTIATALGGVARAGLPLVDLDRYDDGNRAIPGGLGGEPERVIVIGAGFAGLAVANALRNAGLPCVVIEGRDRLGGRAHTVDVGDAPIDLGCSWITDPVGNPMTRFATRSGVLQTNAAIELDVPTSRFYDSRTGVVLLPATGAAASHAVLFEQEAPGISRTLGPLASTKDGIETYSTKHRLKGDARRRGEFFMRLVTELPDATDWEKDSLAAWAAYSSPYYGFGQGDFPRGGYARIIATLGAGADVRFGLRATDVVVEPSGVRVRTRGASGTTDFAGSHVVVTVPLGVLKSGSISFAPELPSAKLGAIDRLGFGVFEKVVMRFPEPYWATEHTHIFHLSDPDPMRFPLIVDYFHLEGVPALAAFNVGRYGTELAGLTDTEIQGRMLDVLRLVQGGPVPRPTDVAITRWSRDPFSRGSYSYIPVGASAAHQRALAEPVGGRILFAGEATSTARYGYADGAMTTGIREAKRLLRQSAVELTPG